MNIVANAPQAWEFTPEELAEVSKTLQTPLMVAFLQSLEFDALTTKHEVELVADIQDAALRIVANEAYAQGQIALAQRLRKLPQVPAQTTKTKT